MPLPANAGANRCGEGCDPLLIFAVRAAHDAAATATLSPPVHVQASGRQVGAGDAESKPWALNIASHRPSTLRRYVRLYNHQSPSRCFKVKPMQAMKQWYVSHPDLFHRRPCDQKGLDISKNQRRLTRTRKTISCQNYCAKSRYTAPRVDIDILIERPYSKIIRHAKPTKQLAEQKHHIIRKSRPFWNASPYPAPRYHNPCNKQYR